MKVESYKRIENATMVEFEGLNERYLRVAFPGSEFVQWLVPTFAPHGFLLIDDGTLRDALELAFQAVQPAKDAS